MRHLQRSFWVVMLIAVLSTIAAGQRPRSVSNSDDPDTPPAPPKVVKAKYMGGFMGYRQKQEGTLNFDEENQRLVFRDKEEREIISMPFDAVVATFPDSESRRMMGSGTTQVVTSTAGIFGLPFMLLKKKFEYFTIQYRDPDTDAEGITSFKLDNKEMCYSMAYALAQRAGLKKRGVIFVRSRTGEALPQPTPAPKP